MDNDGTPPEPNKQKLLDSAVLKSREPDLEITIGGGEHGVNKQGNKAVVRWYHSTILAAHSKYVDTMLASPMVESKTLKISFPETDIDTWDKALKFLDPLECRKMNVMDVLCVARFYDRFDFTRGRDVCDQVSLDYLETLPKQENDLSLDLNVLVDVLVLSVQVSLPKAFEVGACYLKKKLNAKASKCFNAAMFSEKHLKMLVPVLLHIFENDESFHFKLHQHTFTREDIQSNLFPRLFLSESILLTHIEPIPKVTMRPYGYGLHKTSADREYETSIYQRQRAAGFGFGSSERFRDLKVRFSACENSWTIEGMLNGGDNSWLTLFVRPWSGNFLQPPRTGWKPVSEKVEGENVYLEINF